MAQSYQALKDAYDGDLTEPEVWQLGPLIPGSYMRDTSPTQLIDGPGQPAQIEVHGDYCDTLAKRLVEFLNSN